MESHVTEHLQDAFHLGIQKALSVVSTHYIIVFEQLATGYIIAGGVNEDVVVAVVKQSDAAAEGATTSFSAFFKGELFPYANEEDDAPEGPRDRESGS